MPEFGKVYLVGGGPGDPGLLTLRGLELIQKADFILYDGLVNPLILRHSSAKAERTARAEHHGKRILNQDQINQRLIDAAKQKKIVVRLKGGDPFIFGRGSEEAEALAREGIPFEVVPGITAATAAAEYAGISLTHREEASAVAFVTGHEDPTKPESSLDYDNLAHFRGTLVFYMGLHRLPEIAQSLIEAGKDPKTPAAVMSKGATAHQRTITASLEDLPEVVKKSDVKPPSLILVGSCVARRDDIKWFEKKPLIGMNIGITRPIEQAEPEIHRVLKLGAQPILMPMIQVRPYDDWSQFDSIVERIQEISMIVFTSLNGVKGFFGRLWKLGKDTRAVGHCRFACIGEVTALELEKYGLRADLVPEQFRAEEVAKLLIEEAKEDHILWAQASRGRDVLPTMCKEAGLKFESTPVYYNEDIESFSPEAIKLIEGKALNWVGLSSPSIARRFAELLPTEHHAQLGDTLKLASISPVTTAAAQEAGLKISAEATDYTWQGIFNAIESAT